MSGITTAELTLGPNWRERIEHELDNSSLVEMAVEIYDVLATRSGTPTYAEAWAAVCAELLDGASDVRQTTYQTIFDMLWQTLSAEWYPYSDDQTGADEVPIAA